MIISAILRRKNAKNYFVLIYEKKYYIALRGIIQIVFNNKIHASRLFLYVASASL